MWADVTSPRGVLPSMTLVNAYAPLITNDVLNIVGSVVPKRVTFLYQNFPAEAKTCVSEVTVKSVAAKDVNEAITAGVGKRRLAIRVINGWWFCSNVCHIY